MPYCYDVITASLVSSRQRLIPMRPPSTILLHVVGALLLLLSLLTVTVQGRQRLVRFEPRETQQEVSRFERVCDSQPCQHGGQCIDLTSAIGQRKFECTCLEGYDGKTCQRKIDPCADEPCMNGGQCTPRGGEKFHCYCTKGFLGKRCEAEKKDPCAGEPCGANGECVPTNDDFTCECSSGYTGPRCKKKIELTKEVVLTEVKGEKGSPMWALMVTVLTIMVISIFIFLLVGIHCIRVYNRRSLQEAARERRKALGEDVDEIPGFFQTSNRMCYEFFCCTGPPIDKEWSWSKAEKKPSGVRDQLRGVSGIIVPVEEYKSMVYDNGPPIDKEWARSKAEMKPKGTSILKEPPDQFNNEVNISTSLDNNNVRVRFPQDENADQAGFSQNEKQSREFSKPPSNVDRSPRSTARMNGSSPSIYYSAQEYFPEISPLRPSGNYENIPTGNYRNRPTGSYENRTASLPHNGMSQNSFARPPLSSIRRNSNASRGDFQQSDCDNCSRQFSRQSSNNSCECCSSASRRLLEFRRLPENDYPNSSVLCDDRKFKTTPNRHFSEQYPRFSWNSSRPTHGGECREWNFSSHSPNCPNERHCPGQSLTTNNNLISHQPCPPVHPNSTDIPDGEFRKDTFCACRGAGRSPPFNEVCPCKDKHSQRRGHRQTGETLRPRSNTAYTRKSNSSKRLETRNIRNRSGSEDRDSYKQGNYDDGGGGDDTDSNDGESHSRNKPKSKYKSKQSKKKPKRNGKTKRTGSERNSSDDDDDDDNDDDDDDVTIDNDQSSDDGNDSHDENEVEEEDEHNSDDSCSVQVSRDRKRFDDGYASTAILSESDAGGRSRDPQSLQARISRRKEILSRIRPRLSSIKNKLRKGRKNPSGSSQDYTKNSQYRSIALRPRQTTQYYYFPSTDEDIDDGVDGERILNYDTTGLETRNQLWENDEVISRPFMSEMTSSSLSSSKHTKGKQKRGDILASALKRFPPLDKTQPAGTAASQKMPSKPKGILKKGATPQSSRIVGSKSAHRRTFFGKSNNNIKEQVVSDEETSLLQQDYSNYPAYVTDIPALTIGLKNSQGKSYSPPLLSSSRRQRHDTPQHRKTIRSH